MIRMTRRRMGQKAALHIIIVSCIVLLSTALLAGRHIFPTLEVKILRPLYDLPTFIGPAAYVMTQFGSIFAVGIVGFIMFFWRSKKFALEIMASAATAYYLAGTIKVFVGRPRPSGIVEGIAQRYERAAGLGFPSGHTAVATALVTTLWFVTPKRYHWLLVLWVMCVGFSRMYLGLHAPLDIVGGACVGLVSGTVFQFLSTRYLYRQKKKA